MTNSYYNNNTDIYIKNTENVNMKALYKPFLERIPEKGRILDIGFGSGRDSKYFSKKYEVTSIDSAKGFVEVAKKNLDNKVVLLDVRDMNYKNEFDGIWACASLLHLKEEELIPVFNLCYDALKEKGVMYASFKEGDFKGDIGGRYFTYLTDKKIAEILQHTGFIINEMSYTIDAREDRQDKWINLYLLKA